MSGKLLKVHAILSDNIPCFSDKLRDEYPYVSLVGAVFSDAAMEGVPVHVYSKKKGKREVKDLMLQIYDLLHDKQIGNKILRYDSQITFLYPDGITHHGVITFKEVKNE